jgi:hypothetical protein
MSVDAVEPLLDIYILRPLGVVESTSHPHVSWHEAENAAARALGG